MSLRPLIPIIFGVLVVGVVPSPVYALVFLPTENEWITWPDYCKARYVVSSSGKRSNYLSRVTQAQVAYHEQRKGPDAWVYLHHYCAALIYMQRAAAEEDPAKVDFILREAEIEFMNQYALVKPSDPMFPDVVSNIAQVHRRRGDYQVALEYLERAMEHQPEVTSPYALAAIICRESGKIEDGLEVLRRGNRATNGMSAELHYFLGLFYIDVDDLDSAVEHAERAYELGYPLPGLAAKLRRHGRPLSN